MAHLLFDSLTGVSVDNQTALTVQSLLDPLSLPGESLPDSSVTRPPDPVPLDDEDVFQCGKCKKQFTSFSLFMAHKKEHVPGSSTDKISQDFSKDDGTLALALETEFQQQDGENSFAQLEVHAFEESDCCEVGQPIILTEADILSLGIDQASLTITTNSQDFPSLSSVMQSGTYLTSPVTPAPPLKGDSSSETNNNFNVAALETQPVILAPSDISEPSFIATDIGQHQNNTNSGVSGGKQMLEFGNSETSLELLDPETVEFATEQDLQQTLQTATESIIQNTMVDNIQPNFINVPSSETANDNQRPALKSLKLKCCFCSKMFAKNFDLQQHLRSHTGEKPFQCVVCGRAFSQKSNVKKHMATHKVWPKDMSSTLPKEPLQVVAENSASNDGTSDAEMIVDRAYVCQYCTARFQSYYGLKAHMKTHSNQKVYKCIQKNCNQTFNDLDAFVLHSRFHSSEVQYRCHICNTQFCDLRELGLHQYNHNGIRKKTVSTSKPVSQYYQCTKCKSRFSTIEAMEHHISSTSHNYPCPRCGKVFIRERYLRRHLATHGAPSSFMCKQCGKGFRTEQYLNTHMLTHSNLRPFKCSHCSAAFNRKDKLVRHSLIHQSVKRFKCPFRSYLGCLKEFNRQDKLKLHILTHNSATPLHCKICNKTFQRQSLLQQHEKAHHQGAPYLCHQCGMAFKKKVSLGTHICNFQEKSYGQEEVNKAKRTRLQHRSARRSVKRAWATRKKRQSRANSEKSVHLDSPDNVPTIEIIVMPVPVSPGSAAGAANEQGGLYHVVFPTTEVSVENTTALQSQEQHQEMQFFQHFQEGRYDQEVPVASTLM